MAINLTTILGTDSLAANRIVINDNFKSLSSSFNKILSVLDINTGMIDNTKSVIPTMSTGNLSIKGPVGIVINSGDLVLSTGSVKIGGTAFIEFGSQSGITIKRTNKSNGTDSIPILDFSGSTGPTFNGSQAYISLPKYSNSVIMDADGTTLLNNPEYGSIFYDNDTGLHYVFLGNNTDDGFGPWSGSSSPGPGSSNNTNSINPNSGFLSTSNGSSGTWVPLATQEWVFNQIYAVLYQCRLISNINQNPNLNN
jgi:hypothetical protein